MSNLHPIFEEITNEIKGERMLKVSKGIHNRLKELVQEFKNLGVRMSMQDRTERAIEREIKQLEKQLEIKREEDAII